MPKELVISAAPHETRVAILEDGQLCEIYIEREKEFALVGSIYKGRVTRVLPGMQSAFVDIGLDSDAFLYVGDFLENLEDYDHVVSPAENKIEKMEQQGGNTFVPPASVEGEGQPAAPEASSGSNSDTAGDDAAQPQSSSFDSGSSESDDVESDGPQPGNIADPRTGQHTGQQQPRTGQSNQGRHSAPGQSLPGQPPAPRTPFGRQDRGPSNFSGQNRGNDHGNDRGNDRGGNDRGNDRGGRRRGGRWRRGGGRDNQARPGGRDLPQSKYASTSPSAPRPFTPRPYEPPPPAEELPADFEPIILPGESLAKYKDRVPGSGQASTGQTSTPSSSQAPAAAHSSAGSIPPAHSAEAKGPVSESGLPGLPTSLYASPSETPQVPRVSEHGTVVPSSEPSSKEHSEFTPAHEQQPSHAAETGSSLPAGTAELTDDEATALAEQLAEARQEEASAENEAKLGTGRRFDEDAPPPPESAAERDEFIAEVREQEEEDADDEHEIAHQAAQAGEDAHEQTFSSESDQEHDAQMGTEDDDDAMPGNESGAELSADSGSESESGSDSDQALADHAQALADQIGNVAPQSQQNRPQTSARVGGQPNRARFQRPMRRGGRQRSGSGGGGGHRPQRQHDSRHQQAQRRPQLISEMLKAGQEILVQIAKEPLGKKGARITSHVALPGRFLVYMPTVNHIGVSRRIGSADERSRLRRLVTEAKSTFPGGFIVRTAAEGAPDDEIRADVEFLGRTWEKTLSQAEPRKAPSLLHRDLNLVERILRDYVSNDYTAIWINSQEEYSKVVEFVSRFQPKLVERVKLYTKSTPIFEEFGIQQELDKALRPKVWLKSGGYIVINHTEALVAIDVNTGKYVGRGSTRLEDTIVKTNLEAVKEIVRQIRLRDLGGIIILDFIDMEERRNRDKVMAALDSALRADRAPSKALSFNEFGLVAVTRKRTKQALERVLCQPCPYCTGSGMVKSVPTICYEIQAEARKMSPDLDASSLTLRVHPEIAKTLKTREAALIEELEQITRKSVIIQADPTLHWEQYDIY